MRTIKIQSTHASHTEYPSSTYQYGRIGIWGYVTEVNSVTNRVDVKASTGELLRGIPVLSHEWVVKEDEKDYVSSSRNLPPVGSRVFVLMPTHSVSGAFVLCSGYATGEKDTHTLYGNDNNKSECERTYERVSQGGWNHKENYDNGNLSLESNDKKISIQIIQEDGENQGINIKAWEHELIVNKDGIKIKAAKDVQLDAGNNKIKIDGSEIDLNGSSKTLVTYEALNTALSSFLTQLTLAMTTTPIIGNGSPQATWTSMPTSIDISQSQASDLKTGGA